MIEINNVTLIVKNTILLDNINLSLEEGNIYGLVGRNGCGKTLLMKCICGFVHVSQGEIKVNGKRIGHEIDFPERLGCIIETPGFSMNESGLANLRTLAALERGVDPKSMPDLMRKVGLDPGSKLPVKRYSLGMRQRLGIAEAMLYDPDIIILDEPFNSLDEDGVIMFRQMLMEKKEEGKLILIASHSMEDIDLLCDTVFHMKKGCIQSITHKNDREEG